MRVIVTALVAGIAAPKASPADPFAFFGGCSACRGWTGILSGATLPSWTLCLCFPTLPTGVARASLVYCGLKPGPSKVGKATGAACGGGGLALARVDGTVTSNKIKVRPKRETRCLPSCCPILEWFLSDTLFSFRETNLMFQAETGANSSGTGLRMPG